MRSIIFPLANIRAPLTGIGQYSANLISGLMASPFKSSTTVSATLGRRMLSNEALEQHLLSLSKAVNNPQARKNQFRSELARLPGARGLYLHLQRRALARHLKEPVTHSRVVHDLNYLTNPSSRWAAKTPLIYTIYDLSHYRYPHTHPTHRVHYLEQFFTRLSKTDHPIITISEFSKRELAELYGISLERITVTPLAADKHFFPRSDAQRVLSIYGLTEGRFCLALGTREPRKNLATTLLAYTQQRHSFKQQYPLVIAGAPGWQHGPVESDIKRLQAAGELVLLPYVSQAHLPHLYSGARMTLLPSLYEGFGLPIIEAMACGSPVVTSDLGAMREVAGSAAVTVEPLNVDALSAAMRVLVEDPDFHQYRQQGLARAKEFTWDKCVQHTHALYQQLG